MDPRTGTDAPAEPLLYTTPVQDYPTGAVLAH